MIIAIIILCLMLNCFIGCLVCYHHYCEVTLATIIWCTFFGVFLLVGVILFDLIPEIIGKLDKIVIVRKNK